MTNRDRNYWPHSIIASIGAIIAAIVYTIIFSLDYPVEMDDTYLKNYHEVDKSYNELVQKNIKFNKNYSFKYSGGRIKEGENRLTFSLSREDGSYVDNAKIIVLLTRPDTDKHNIKLSKPVIKNGVYTFESVELNKPGRWNIIARVNVDEHLGNIRLHADTREDEIKVFDR